MGIDKLNMYYAYPSHRVCYEMSASYRHVYIFETSLFDSKVSFKRTTFVGSSNGVTSLSTTFTVPFHLSRQDNSICIIGFIADQLKICFAF